MIKFTLLAALTLLSFQTITASSFVMKINQESDSNSINVTDYIAPNTEPEEEYIEPSDESPSGNIAMSGTNGLTDSSYSSSTTYFADHPASAFDGWTNTENLGVGGTKYLRGLWLSNSNYNTNQWLSVDFGKKVSINSFKIRSGYLPRSVQDIIIQSSEDGVSFTDVQSYTMEYSMLPATRTLTETLKTRYFRLYIVNNYGNAYIDVSELEIYQ